MWLVLDHNKDYKWWFDKALVMYVNAGQSHKLWFAEGDKQDSKPVCSQLVNHLAFVNCG